MSVENVFIELLRASLWGKKVEVSDSFKDWGAVFALAKAQSVLAMVANTVLNDTRLSAQIPSEMKGRLRNFILVNVSTNAMLNNTLMYVVSTLNSSGIDSVLLKGQGVASNYPMPELRACGDIDIYVGSDNYLRACEVLGAVATWKEEDCPEDNMKHYNVRIGKISVEIHRYSEVLASKYYDRIYQAYSDEGLTKNLRVLDFAGVSVNTPADDFNAFYIFNHLWHHFITSGVGLRQFCDWMLFLHSNIDSIDKNKLGDMLNRMNLMIPWQSLGCVLVDVLGMSVEEFPFYDNSKVSKLPRIMKHIIEEGNFGHESKMHKGRQGEGYFRRKIKSLFLHIIRSLQLFVLFPSHVSRQFVNTVASGIRSVWRDKVMCN